MSSHVDYGVTPFNRNRNPKSPYPNRNHSLAQRRPDYHQNLTLFFVAHIGSFLPPNFVKIG